MILIVGILAHACSLVIADVESGFIEHGVVPDVLDKAPNQLFTVTYGDKSVQFAEEWTPTAVMHAPSVKWDFDSTSVYTLIITDLDYPRREKPTLREFVVWIVTNIPGNDVSQGQIINEYCGLAPPKDGGFHRAVYLVYKQPQKLTFDEPYSTNRSIIGRRYFSQRDFSRKYNLGHPIAGNMCFSKFDDYVTNVTKEFMSG